MAGVGVRVHADDLEQLRNLHFSLHFTLPSSHLFPFPLLVALIFMLIVIVVSCVVEVGRMSMGSCRFVLVPISIKFFREILIDVGRGVENRLELEGTEGKCSESTLLLQREVAPDRAPHSFEFLDVFCTCGVGYTSYSVGVIFRNIV